LGQAETTMYRYETVIRLRNTDAAGVIYFADVFTLAHECYEAFLDEHLPLGAILDEGEYLAPIVHADADIARPMRLSDKIVIEMQLAKTGNSSFELAYRFIDEQGETTAKAATIHVLLEAQTRQPVRIPERFKEVLRAI
jgi:1,4-dihydroxy-2-naphthoyl-CoA hydrolase